MLCSCFASNSLIDQQAVRSGFCGSGYGTRPRVLVFVGSGYDDRTDSERAPNAPRMGNSSRRSPNYSRTQTHRNQTVRPVDRSAWKKNKNRTHGKLIILSIYLLDTCKMWELPIAKVINPYPTPPPVNVVFNGKSYCQGMGQHCEGYGVIPGGGGTSG